MLELFQKFIDLGAIVVLPILIFIFGMALGTKPKKSLCIRYYCWGWFCRIKYGSRFARR